VVQTTSVDLFSSGKTISMHSFLDMVQLYACPQIDNIEYENWCATCLQVDGIMLHFSIDVNEVLSDKFLNFSLGRNE
jgi:hypothetical protein